MNGSTPSSSRGASETSSVAKVIHYHRDASGKTAMRRKTWSAPMRWLYSAGLFHRPGAKVLDYGCGHGADVVALREHQVDAIGFDPVHSPEGGAHQAGQFDIVTCHYVLNTLPSTAERMFVIDGMLAALKPGGRGFVTVRRDVRQAGWTSKGTYQDGSVQVAKEIAVAHNVGCAAVHRTTAFEIYSFTKPL
ncbi:MAG: methyltransferase domain-containing protein [Dehalococcoidia bacterium]